MIRNVQTGNMIMMMVFGNAMTVHQVVTAIITMVEATILVRIAYEKVHHTNLVKVADLVVEVNLLHLAGKKGKRENVKWTYF